MFMKQKIIICTLYTNPVNALIPDSLKILGYFTTTSVPSNKIEIYRR